MAGRPRFKITPEILVDVQNMAASGLTCIEISHAIGCSLSTLHLKKKQFTDFSDAIKRGRAQGLAKISNCLFQSAIKGNITAMIFYLKNRGNGNWGDNYNSHKNVKNLTEEEIDNELENYHMQFLVENGYIEKELTLKRRKI